MAPTVSLIVARADNGVIGDNGRLPWRIAADMKWFRDNTMGKPVVMGRKTWDSLPKKPLPGRANIIITRDRGFIAGGALVVHALGEALDIGRQAGASEIMVIGGAGIYALAMPLARRVYLTRVHLSPEGDAHLPDFSAHEWREVSCVCHDAAGDVPAFDFVVLERKE